MIECDASIIRIETVLPQESHPVVFYSEKLIKSQRKYITYEL
ncbi:unnamed protein product [Spirodela intermedia]|uniref:Reverse transcriptase RNase H-like domain-containing protein n=2 Tax=Spirodela intermedia TaxID=51605 RepID=A0A7I8JPH9_SPIIN|nr:unnamed protein product [Spirodela intermedia]CAA6672056.1 unnamed protein product [Spirodela intermedia]CAA7409222.1 unnamed protein product [Spirodela intermedia]